MRPASIPETAAGLALTVALVGVVIVFVVFGVVIAMIRSNSGVVNVDVTVTRWAAAHATSVSLDVFGWVTLAGSTVGVVAVALGDHGLSPCAGGGGGAWPSSSSSCSAARLLLSNAVKHRGRARPSRRAAVPRAVRALVPQRSRHGGRGDLGRRGAGARRGASPRVRAILGGTAAGDRGRRRVLARVFLGAHWTSDVIGGLLLGWTWFALCAVAFGGRVLRLGAPVQEASARPARDRPSQSQS